MTEPSRDFLQAIDEAAERLGCEKESCQLKYPYDHLVISLKDCSKPDDFVLKREIDRKMFYVFRDPAQTFPKLNS